MKFGTTFSEPIGAALAFQGAGVGAQLIPYASTSTAVTDMLGGKVDVTAATPSTVLPLYPDQVSTLLNATKMPLPDDINEKLGKPSHAVDLGYPAINFPRGIDVHPDTPDDMVIELSRKIGDMLGQKSFETMMGRMEEEIIFTPYDEAQAQYAELLGGIKAAVRSIRV